MGHDLNPSNAFSDFGTDLSKGLKNPIVDVALGAGALALPFLAPELLAGAGSLFGADAAAGAAGGGALGFAGDVAAGGDVASFLADPAAVAAGGAGAGLPADALALTAPAADVTGTAGVGGALGTVPGSLDALATGVGTGAGTAGSVGAPLDLLSGAGGAAGGGGAAAGGGGFTGLLSTAGGALKTAAPFIGAAGLGLTGLNAYEQKKSLDALNNQEKLQAANANAIAGEEQSAAAPLLNNGQTLMSYLTTNTLPPQFQAQVDQTVATMKAGIIQGYASRGMSTDPTKNSGLQQDLAAVDQQALTMKGNFETMLSTAGNQMVQTANQLLASGLSATQLSSEIPIQMAQLDANLNKQMSDALSNFAAAMNGGRGIAGNKTTNNLIGLG